jgi:hypothetical protein
MVKTDNFCDQLQAVATCKSLLRNNLNARIQERRPYPKSFYRIGYFTPVLLTFYPYAKLIDSSCSEYKKRIHDERGSLICGPRRCWQRDVDEARSSAVQRVVRSEKNASVRKGTL